VEKKHFAMSFELSIFNAYIFLLPNKSIWFVLNLLLLHNYIIFVIPIAKSVKNRSCKILLQILLAKRIQI